VPTYLALPIALLLLARAPDGSAARDADQSLARGREALAAGRFDEAGRAFEEALKSRPQDLRGWTLLARACCSQAEFEAEKKAESDDVVEKWLAKAEEAARKAVDLDRGAPAAWAELGHVLTRAGSVEEAIASLYQAEKLGDPTVEVLVDLSDDLLAARQAAADRGDDAGAAARVGEAKGALERAEKLAEGQVAVAQRLAKVCTMARDDAGTLKALRRAATLRPSDSQLHEALIAESTRQHAFDDAIRFYSGLIDEPTLGRWYASRAHELKGNWLYGEGRDAAAAADEYRRAEQELVAAAKARAELKPQVDAYVPTLRASRGAALTKAERFAEAEAALDSAIDLDPKHAGALAQLHALEDAMWKKYGGDGMGAEKFDEMRSFAAKLCVAEPDHAENWNNYGFFAREAKRYEESNRAYRRALELEPDNARYLNDAAIVLLYHLDRDYDQARAWLERACERAEAGSKDEARRTAARLDDETTLGDAFNNLINVVQAQGDLDDAKKLLDQFEKRLPKRSEVGYWRKKLTPELVPEPAPEPEKNAAGDGKKQEPPPATGDGKKDGDKKEGGEKEEDADE
jgi:tetratricopeptide (TPR) repeat protein